MRLGLVALALVVACGGNPPRKRHVAPPVDDVQRRYVKPEPLVLRIVPPNPNGLTWPLTKPPSLEPHYRFGFTWPLVCERRGVLPDDVLVYSEAWCAYAKNPNFDLARALSALRSSPALSNAILLDLANLAVDGHFDYDVAWDTELRETIIALDIELGRIYEASKAADDYFLYVLPQNPRTCSADLFGLMFKLDPSAIDRLPEQVRRHGTTGCGNHFRRLACIVWSASGRSPMNECASVVLDEDDRAIIRAVAARLQWGEFLEPEKLLEIAKLASSALQIYDAEGLAMRALQRTLQASCKPLEEVRKIAALIDGDHRKQERFDDARAELLAMTEFRCLEYQVRRAGR